MAHEQPSGMASARGNRRVRHSACLRAECVECPARWRPCACGSECAPGASALESSGARDLRCSRRCALATDGKPDPGVAQAAYRAKRAAAASPHIPTKPVYSVQTVDLSPGSPPPIVRVSHLGAAVTFIDRTGAPWDIIEVNNM